MKKSNIKSPLVFRVGVVLMCVMMLTCHMMSGLYARYTSSAQGSATATVAKLDVQMSGANTNYSFVGLPDSGNVHVVILDFTVTNTGDVTYEYQLNLRLSNDSSYDTATPDAYITLASPQDLTNVKLIAGNDAVIDSSASILTSNTFTGFSAGYAYYAVSLDGGATYTCCSDQVDGKATLTCDTLTLAIGETHNYRVLYFVQLECETTLNNINLLYSVTCEQVD